MLTVSKELNKLAFNIGMGRDFAGVHYRSDATEGLLVGEDVAIALLRDLVTTLPETFQPLSFRRFDGSKFTI